MPNLGNFWARTKIELVLGTSFKKDGVTLTSWRESEVVKPRTELFQKTWCGAQKPGVALQVQRF